LNKTKIAIWAKDASSGEGFDADVYVSSWPRLEPNPDFIVYNIEFVPSDEQRDPTWT
jgi:hypothetical protein